MTGCTQCDFGDYQDLMVEEIPDRIRRSGPRARLVLGAARPDTAVARPDPRTWSALEYACHIRDVLLIQRERVVLAQVQQCPAVSPMCREERVVLCRYRAHSIPDVLNHLDWAAELCAIVFAGLDHAGWQRRLQYPWPTPAVRTVSWLGRHTVHEVEHHLWDIGRVLALVSETRGG